ncbi:MAG TPA: dihydrolipoyl dehydrogenase [Candidatus Aquicultor sp.]
MIEERYDIAIIGGGPGGYASALRAAELGLRVVVLERDKLGGTCLHRGCIPTTSLLESARVLDTINRSRKFGISVTDVSYDWQEVQKAKYASINRLFMGLNVLFKQRNVQVAVGKASLKEPGRVSVASGTSTRTIAAEHIIIATGSIPREIPALADGEGFVLNTSQALEIASVPSSVAIVGGGAYGTEFASMFRSFGAEVSIIERAPRLAPRDDKDVSKYLERAFSKRGIKVFTNAALQHAQFNDGIATLQIKKDGEPQQITVQKVLQTVGRTANTDGIDIEGLGIQTKAGFITTDASMKTNIDGIYAVGDVTFNPQYANFAFQEGIHAVETIAGINPPPLNLKQIPIYSYGYPELAKVGYDEEEAKEAGFDVETVGLPFQIVSRSAIDKEDIGFAKMVAQKDGTIIGIHLVGPGVVNLIAEAMLITNWEATAADVAQFLHPHPTFAEAIGETAMKLAGKPLHSL